MLVASICRGAMALAATVSSHPLTSRAAQATGQALELTDLLLTDVDAGNTTLSFHVYDPDPITNETASCTASWKHNSTDYPNGLYRRCGNSTFAWRLDNVVSLHNFTLSLDHSFIDPAVGDPPYDHILNFARVALNDTLLDCQALGGRSNCQQKDDIIYARVYGSVAR